MRRLIGFAAVAAIAAMSAPAKAQAADVSPVAKSLFVVAIHTEKLSTPAARYELVQASQSYCEEVERVYPRNSPAEEEWINTEMKGEEARVSRVMRSAELGRRVASVFVTSCKASVAGYASHKQRALTALAYTFLRFSRDANYFAEKNGVDGKQLGFGGLSLVVEGLLVAALAEQS